MSKKPSIRIEELFNEDTTHQGFYKNFFALVNYLDEQWEQNNKPPENQCPNCKGIGMCCCVGSKPPARVFRGPGGMVAD